MAERKILARKRRPSAQQPIIKLKRTSDETNLPNLKHFSILFPLTSSDDVVNCLKALISPKNVHPDLTLISLILGTTERILTSSESNYDVTSGKLVETKKFSAIKFDAIKSLYAKFFQHLRSPSFPPTQIQENESVKTDTAPESSPIEDRRLNIKLVADKVWVLLARSYRKDRLRMQYLHSLLTEHKLDSFGVTSSVAAACQLLGFNDVNMVLSEDHSWIEFGNGNSRETVEVTWHGKCTEDRRGSKIESSTKKWVYSGESPIRCTPHMAAAALIMKLNPCIDGDLKSIELLNIKRKLMWFLYEEGFLNEFPTALIELAKLEMFCSKEPLLSTEKTNHEMEVTNIDDDTDDPRPAETTCLNLLQKALDIDMKCYNNCLVHPFLEQGEFYYRISRHKEALKCWADAANVISQYKYGKEDEEVYKRFYEIANEFVPDMLKKSLSDETTTHLKPDPQDLVDINPKENVEVKIGALGDTMEMGRGKKEGGSVDSSCGEISIPSLPLWLDPQVFADFLSFYDGICCWEEDSQTPVLHVTWAQHMCTSLLKFNSQMRVKKIIIECSDGNSSTGSSGGLDNSATLSSTPKVEDKIVTRSHDHEKNNPSPVHAKSPSNQVVRDTKKPDSHSPSSENNSKVRPPNKSLPHKLTNNIEICLKPLKACNTYKPGNVYSRKHDLLDMEVFTKEKDRGLANNENLKYLPYLEDQNLNTFEEFRREIHKHGFISRRSTLKDSETLNPILEVLSKNCSNSIFNPEFFQGRGEPFLKSPLRAEDKYLIPQKLNVDRSVIALYNPRPVSSRMEGRKMDLKPAKNPPKNYSSFLDSGILDTSIATLTELSSTNTTQESRVCDISSAKESNGASDGIIIKNFTERQTNITATDFLKDPRKVVVQLKSSKMKTMKDLLMLERLNTQAIKLQLTAQSNTIFKNKLSTSNPQISSINFQGEKLPERDAIDKYSSAASTASTLCTPERSGESKVTRRVLRNRVMK